MKPLIPLLLLITLLPFVAAEEEDITVLDLELEKLLNLGSALLASALAILTFLSYKRSHNKRLMYVTAAFTLFALKLFIFASELIIESVPLIDPITAVLDFAILACFFLGIIK
ncbi:hypothetical protein H6504_01380 [Candidatus Woesearchaeota archaeon]|nr:hypothetical protein [Candidatus Woesearchaeota archaeon]